jgi:hypothetical protein
MTVQRAFWLAALLASCSGHCGHSVDFHSIQNTGFEANVHPVAQHSAKFAADCIRRCANNDACISGFWKSNITGINCILFGFRFTPDLQRTEFGTLYFVRGENVFVYSISTVEQSKCFPQLQMDLLHTQDAKS